MHDRTDLVPPGPNEPMVVASPRRRTSQTVVSTASIQTDETEMMKASRRKRERSYESLNYARMMNQSYFTSMIHAVPERIKQIGSCGIPSSFLGIEAFVCSGQQIILHLSTRIY